MKFYHVFFSKSSSVLVYLPIVVINTLPILCQKATYKRLPLAHKSRAQTTTAGSRGGRGLKQLMGGHPQSGNRRVKACYFPVAFISYSLRSPTEGTVLPQLTKARYPPRYAHGTHLQKFCSLPSWQCLEALAASQYVWL